MTTTTGSSSRSVIGFHLSASGHIRPTGTSCSPDNDSNDQQRGCRHHCDPDHALEPPVLPGEDELADTPLVVLVFRPHVRRIGCALFEYGQGLFGGLPKLLVCQ